jgi:DNA-directed RNA polymerase specialized sigma24 family protein
MANATTARVEQGARRATSDLTFGPRLPESSGLHQDSELFNDWFSRCRGALHFTACRVLGGTEGAELAVQNCWLRASRNPPTFDREGAFRSWLLRILIDEASTFLQEAATRRMEYERTHSSPRAWEAA